MWSVVEKTALAEAEVEYEDHTSDTVLVAFPVRRRAMRRIAHRHLDDDALDASGQSRDLLLASKIAYGLYRVTQAPEGNWAKAGASLRPRRQARRAKLFKAAKVEGFERLNDVPADDDAAGLSARIRWRN